MDVQRSKRFVDLAGLSTSTVSIAMLVDLFLRYNAEEELSPHTISTRKTHLKQFVTFCQTVGVDDIQLINNQFIDKYFVQYRDTHSKSTTNTGKRIMKVFLTWVRDYKEVDVRAQPEAIKSLKIRDKTPKAIDREIIEHVVSECPIEQDRLIIAIFAETGIRISELTRLRVCDLREDELDIYGKGQVDRTVMVTDELAAQLAEFVENNHRSGEDYLFQNLRKGYGKQLRKDTVWRHVKRWFLEIGGINMHPHQLRHTFAINMLLAGCDIVTIKELLGHDDINTTMEYLRVANIQIKKAYKSHMGKSFLA